MKYGVRWSAVKGCIAALLVGCSWDATSAPPITAEAVQGMHSMPLRVIYSFKGHPYDGSYPRANLISVKGTLYGTTSQGGPDCSPSGGCGTVFVISRSGKERVLHSFGGNGDGDYPYAALTELNGTFFGTTYEGGRYGEGTVFSISTTGTETVLHSFGGTTGDGAYPYAGLTNINGTLYGTTTKGGHSSYGCGCGTVYSVTPSGTENVIYSFKIFNYGDGNYPTSNLINVGGVLYGTTELGGGIDDTGTVFSITPSGDEQVLHSFKGSEDGEYPYGGLVDVNGTLYGTTIYGGSGACNDSGLSGCGVVFAIPAGSTSSDRVLYSFEGKPDDGAYPYANLINVNGTLYGTTHSGGSKDEGTVFKVTTDGNEAVVVQFTSYKKGLYPYSGLLNVKKQNLRDNLRRGSK